MKKYRLTRITVKTREIVLLSKNAADEIQNSVCPTCHAPLAASLPAVETNIERQLPMLPPAKIYDDQD